MQTTSLREEPAPKNLHVAVLCQILISLALKFLAGKMFKKGKHGYIWVFRAAVKKVSG
jgi:hypothetical protein